LSAKVGGTVLEVGGRIIEKVGELIAGSSSRERNKHIYKKEQDLSKDKR
jgi:hypothetical protein